MWQKEKSAPGPFSPQLQEAAADGDYHYKETSG